MNGRHSNWYWECVNVLYCYGLLYRKLARDTLQSMTEGEFGTRWMEVTKQLSIAAGIFAFVSEHVASKFFVFPKDMPLPEVLPETFALLSRISLAECQELAVKRATQKENNPIMSAQLAMACAHEYVTCSSIADKIQIPEKKDSWMIRNSIRKFLDWKSIMWKALAYRYMAESHSRKQEPGDCLAYMEIAEKEIETAKTDPKAMDANTDSLWDDYSKLKSDINQSYKQAIKDNDEIYHEIVRRERVLPITPKFLAKPIEFVAPPPSDISIQTKDSSGVFLCAIQ